MGGRFGKYGDAKRKERLRKTRHKPPAPLKQGKEKPFKDSYGRKKRGKVQKRGS